MDGKYILDQCSNFLENVDDLLVLQRNHFQKVLEIVLMVPL